MNFLIVIDDGGEMKTVSAAEIEKFVQRPDHNLQYTNLPSRLYMILDAILDDRKENECLNSA